VEKLARASGAQLGSSGSGSKASGPHHVTIACPACDTTSDTNSPFNVRKEVARQIVIPETSTSTSAAAEIDFDVGVDDGRHRDAGGDDDDAISLSLSVARLRPVAAE